MLEQFFSYPSIDYNERRYMVKEQDDKILLQVELPGVKKKDVNVSFENDIISIKAKREDAFDVYKYEKSFIVPHGCDIENVTANLEDGILLIELPKKNKTKSIPIL